jgi:hypothetical protein
MDGYQFKHVTTLDGTDPSNSSTTNDSAYLVFPQSLVWTPNGKLYILDRGANAIMVLEQGKIRKIAGGSSGMRNGPADQALFQKPANMCLSATNDLLVADSGNHAIRLICEGEVTTFSGGNGAGKTNGSSAIAKFDTPNAVALHPTSFDVYVSDSGNHCIRVIASAIVSDFAGCGEPGRSDGPKENAKFRSPEGLLVTSTGDILVADTQNHVIRLISGGNVSTFAGDGTPRFGDGALLSARFKGPTSLCFSPIGDLVVVDQQNSRLRLVSNGQVSTIVGTDETGFKDGNTSKASFNYPTSAVWTKTGHLLVADGYNQRIRSIHDENHVMTPDFGLAVELHEKPEKFSLALGDVEIPMKNKTWHLHRCVLQQRCPHLLKDDVLPLLSFLDISERGQKLFWLFIYRDSLPEGQFGVSVENVKDWIEIHELASIASLERLASHARWRVSYLLSNCDSKDTFAAISAYVVETLPTFTDTLLDIIATRKSTLFEHNFTHVEKALQPSAYTKLLTRANLTVHPLPRPTTSPQGHLAAAMESICPSGPGVIPPVQSTIRLVCEGTHVFHAHSGILVPRWPLIFNWFFTKTEGVTSFDLPTPGEAGGISVSTLTGMLHYFYTGRLDKLKHIEDCRQIASQIVELKLTTASCGVLVAYVLDRVAEANKHEKPSKDKCNIM